MPARLRPGRLDELRKALRSPSAPAKHKWRSYRAVPRLSSDHDAIARWKRIRGKTNQVRIGHSFTRTQISRIRRVKSFASTRRLKSSLPVRGLLAAPHASKRNWRTIRRTNGEGIGDGQIAARRPPRASRNRRWNAGIRKHRHQILGLLAAPHASKRNSQTIRRTNGEGISDGQIAAFRPSKASRNRCGRMGPSDLG